jgi:LacI family transcriptional regulator, repressor for deo operon, udp, cdd, tsx, nupC, and nupG
MPVSQSTPPFSLKAMNLNSVSSFTNGNRAVACDPMLTTVEQRGVEVGKEAATILMDQVERLTGPDKIEKRVVRTRLVVRGSSR